MRACASALCPSHNAGWLRSTIGLGPNFVAGETVLAVRVHPGARAGPLGARHRRTPDRAGDGSMGGIPRPRTAAKRVSRFFAGGGAVAGLPHPVPLAIGTDPLVRVPGRGVDSRREREAGLRESQWPGPPP